MSDHPGNSAAPPAKASNPAALTSMILGVLLCIPLLTSIPAIILGVIGLRKARQVPEVGGRGLAIAGLILGIVGVVGWTAMGVGGYMAYKVGRQMVHDIQAEVAQPGQMVARNFVQRLSNGDVRGAADVTAPEISRNDVERISHEVQQLGSLQDLKIDSVLPAQVNGIWQVQLSGAARFSRGSRRFSITVAKETQGLRVVQYSFE